MKDVLLGDGNVHQEDLQISEVRCQSADINLDSFQNPYVLFGNVEQRKTMDRIILPWAESLPISPGLIADIAAGQGIEALALSNHGYNVTAVDGAENMVENSYFDKTIWAQVHELPFDQSELSGALLKDAMFFLSGKTRRKMLSDLHGMLVPGGSLLILTEEDSQGMIVYETGNNSHRVRENLYSADGWEDKVEEIQSWSGNKIIRIYFPTHRKQLEHLADKSGFEYELVDSMAFRDTDIGKEHRWGSHVYGQIVVKFTKPR